MARYRLEPSPAQEAVLLWRCPDARHVWNLAVEQRSQWRPGRKPAPGHLEQCRQLTAARAGNPWLAQGSQMVQQQALRDFDQARRNLFVSPAHTSQRCAKCGTVDANSRKSQALFACTSCGYSGNADVNAAKNIAAGHAVRGGLGTSQPVNREPQLPLLVA